MSDAELQLGLTAIVVCLMVLGAAVVCAIILDVSRNPRNND